MRPNLVTMWKAHLYIDIQSWKWNRGLLLRLLESLETFLAVAFTKFDPERTQDFATNFHYHLLSSLWSHHIFVPCTETSSCIIINITATLDVRWQDDLSNSSSLAFKNLARSLKENVSNMFESVEGGVGARMLWPWTNTTKCSVCSCKLYLLQTRGGRGEGKNADSRKSLTFFFYRFISFISTIPRYAM